MLGKTHSTFGVACALGALIVTKQTDPIMAGVAVASASVGALSPDLDHPQATLSQKNILFGILSRFLSGLSSHRRFWHTIPADLIFSAAYFAILMVLANLVGMGLQTFMKVPDLMPYIVYATVFFFIGALSHSVADAFNPEGSPLLFPIQPNLSKKISVPIISVTTGTIGEMAYMAAFSVAVFVLGFIYINNIIGFDVVKFVMP